ncbi:MAG: hypothetical protein ABSF16_13125 [Terracidiphilus sp.]
MVRFASLFTVLVLAAAGFAAGQDDQQPKLKVSDKPLTAEQLAVYRVVLGSWMAQEMPALNLSIQTVPLGDTGPTADQSCFKRLDLEPASPAIVHRFRQQDLAQLGPSRTLTLVDPDRQKQEVRSNDPEKTVGEGRTIEDAVSNGFAHGLATLSEIRFDKQHKHAIVSYGFFCGSLCGNGGALVLEKVDGVWQRKSRCGEWIS